ncbi:hypothetical protein JNL27_08355 [bacterium]|nr:hypothetical protein [bacterium]
MILLLLTLLFSCYEDKPAPDSILIPEPDSVSTDTDWVLIPEFKDKFVNAMVIRDSSIFVAGKWLVYLSTDNGKHWEERTNGIPVIRVLSMTDMVHNGVHYLFVGTADVGIYRSTDEGLNWTEANNGLGGSYIRALGTQGSTLYASASGINDLGNLYVSYDQGGSWAIVQDVQCRGIINGIAGNERIVCVTTDGCGVWKSSDNGVSWDSAAGNIKPPPETENYYDKGQNFAYNYSCYALGSDIYIGSHPCFFVSYDNLKNWYLLSKFYSQGTPQYNSPHYSPARVVAVAVAGNNILASSNGGGIQVTPDHGATWYDYNDGFPEGVGISTFVIKTKDSLIFAGNGWGLYVNSKLLK